MEVKEAVRASKKYLADLFADEHITDVGLEEVQFDELSNAWKVTIGFSRPWENNAPFVTRLGIGHNRSYKVVHVSDDDGEIMSLTDRILDYSK